MVRGQAGGGIKQHGVFLLRGAGGPGGNAAVLRVSGAGKGQNGIENLLFQLRGHAGNIGRRHQLSIMENKWDIGTMPWGAAALNGEILIEEINQNDDISIYDLAELAGAEYEEEDLNLL